MASPPTPGPVRVDVPSSALNVLEAAIRLASNVPNTRKPNVSGARQAAAVGSCAGAGAGAASTRTVWAEGGRGHRAISTPPRSTAKLARRMLIPDPEAEERVPRLNEAVAKLIVLSLGSKILGRRLE